MAFARHHCDRHGFAVAMGCSAQVGYAVGAIFEFAKALLPCRPTATLSATRIPIYRGLIGLLLLGGEFHLMRVE